jgi:hypothetical protein
MERWSATAGYQQGTKMNLFESWSPLDYAVTVPLPGGADDIAIQVMNQLVGRGWEVPSLIATTAYDIAEAMVAERERRAK